uniref:AAA+ ATPase domain-containing protein n=1 Tax=Oryza punctata TaxID=4537 RepID=A0A0E0MI68_ORYPU
MGKVVQTHLATAGDRRRKPCGQPGRRRRGKRAGGGASPRCGRRHDARTAEGGGRRGGSGRARRGSGLLGGGSGPPAARSGEGRRAASSSRRRRRGQTVGGLELPTTAAWQDSGRPRAGGDGGVARQRATSSSRLRGRDSAEQLVAATVQQRGSEEQPGRHTAEADRPGGRWRRRWRSCPPWCSWQLVAAAGNGGGGHGGGVGLAAWWRRTTAQRFAEAEAGVGGSGDGGRGWWLRGESPVLAPLSSDGRRRGFSVASLLEDIVLASPGGRSRLCPFVGLVASRLAAAVPVLAFSWVCVLVMSHSARARSMANHWRIAAMGAAISICTFLLSPIIGRIINLLANKVVSFISFDTPGKLRILKMQSLPELKLLIRVEEERKMLSMVEKNDGDVVRFDDQLKRLRSAQYQAEEILDLVEYRRLEKKIQGGSPSPNISWVLQRVGTCVARCNTSWPGRYARHALLGGEGEGTRRLRSAMSGTKSDDAPANMSKMELKKILGEIEKSINEAYNVFPHLMSPRRTEAETKTVMGYSHSEVTTVKPPDVVIGRDEDRDEILAFLHETESDGQRKSSRALSNSIIGIHGIAGSGKSTLAQYVCSHEKKEKQNEPLYSRIWNFFSERRQRDGHFDLIMWVHVSQHFSVDKIFSYILKEATGICPQSDSHDTLEKNLEEALSGKRFLLVLDDVRYNMGECQQKLQKLVFPLKSGKAGSKILVTSQTRDAISALGARRHIPISDMDDNAFLKLFMNYALEGANIREGDRGRFEVIGAGIAKRLRKSPLAARIVGGQLRIRPNIQFWMDARDRDLLDETMGALLWSYHQLDEQVRRCFSYCSIFPRGHRLDRDELVNLWVAVGFITPDTKEDAEAVARQCFDELVSFSFLNKQTEELTVMLDYFTVHDLLHDLAEKVAGSDCFRIQKDWTGDLPQDVRHLYIETYNKSMFIERISKRTKRILGSLHTLIIAKDETKTVADRTVLESIFKTMRKLRVLKVNTNRITASQLLIPESVGKLMHLRYFGFATELPSKLVVPSTITKLYQLQVLDFGSCMDIEFSSKEYLCSKLINLRRVINSQHLNIPNFGRLTSLETVPSLKVTREAGFELQQLKQVNKLRGKLVIEGLENVESKKAAVEANLAAKKCLKELVLAWDDASSSPDVEAEVLESLCPPMELETLEIRGYSCLRYPSWLMSQPNGPKQLHKLVLRKSSQLKSIPQHSELFTHLHMLEISSCSWDSLPDNMERLTSLEDLTLECCSQILSLPALPRSLKRFRLLYCNEELTLSCLTSGHPNFQKIEHIQHKEISSDCQCRSWVVSPIITNLINKGFSYLDLGRGRSAKLNELENKVSELRLILEAVEESPICRDRLEPLLKKLKLAFYEAEDILDDIEYYHLERQNLFQPDDKFRRNWMKKLQRVLRILDKIENIINEAHKVLPLINLPGYTRADNRQTVSSNSRTAVTTATPPHVVIGRDKDCDNIIAMLHENVGDIQPGSESALCYSIIGIHGIAGSGKSTLAQLVCANEKKAGHFDLIMWVHVSQNFSVDTILTEMLEAATGNQRDNFNNSDILQQNLEKELSRNRFLLVLDDIWYNGENQQELRKILTPLKAGKAGSKILATSRTMHALLALGAGRCILISDMDDNVFLKLFMHYALEGANIDEQDRRKFEVIGADIAKKLRKSPLAARTVGGQLRIRLNVDFWGDARDRDLLNQTMGALWWSYQHLDEQAKRCFSYCSIFPRRHRLKRDELVTLWVAEGFIRTSDAGEEEADGRKYFDELVSSSFLMKQTGGGPMNYFTVHDLLHDLAENVAGSDCFRIERGREGVIPRGVRHLSIETYDETMLTDRSLEMESLHTLIIHGSDIDMFADETLFESMFTKMRKLRVLRVKTFGFKQKKELSFPNSISNLKHLRYFGFATGSTCCKLVLPCTMTKLYHLQVLDFGCCSDLVFSSKEDLCRLNNLRHFIASDQELKIPNFGRLTSLQTIPLLTVTKEAGCEIQQLAQLNKLRGRLQIEGLENVESEEAAVGANLAAKKHLKEVVLVWDWNDESCSPDVQAEVLEGLCPPMELETLEIRGYRCSRYPSWLVDQLLNNGPKFLHQLKLNRCSPLGSIPQQSELFSYLRSLVIWCCSWDSLPDNMERLKTLEKLELFLCPKILLLPALPLSLKTFRLFSCSDELKGSN